MTIHIDWSDLEKGNRLREDTVTLKVTDYDEDDITQFRLRLTGAVNWWKGIEIKNASGQVVTFTEATGPQIGVSEVEWDAIVGGKIVLWKAKVFGVHTPMYDLDIDEHIMGKKLAFRWSAD
ncbi:hypothetical protein SAMN04488564_10674 [Lentzea waywayandensis]|uniref:Uncharacterized protein n=1 Tax=Lentzea waywayandensis TaxID=84724 RepID=A0A1I6EWP6_9PSEU|nr:hypothetical protein [Lentzea waywayandensis]SFR22139.1 hypothetical protein SAMN04488564_10674 [Lentzea waywayandensis]